MEGEKKFQFGLLGYNKKDVDIKFDSMREDFYREKEMLISEKEDLQETIRQLREHEAELEKRNDEFSEVERSVSSIMSVTQRASDKMYEEAASQKQRVADVVSNTAQEIARFRQDMINVRQNMNGVLGELQNRLDIIDNTLKGTVGNLVSVKNELLNDKVSSAADIQKEVDQLLKLASRDIDIVPVSKYKVPDLGHYSSSLITNSAAKVMNSRSNAYNGIASDATSSGDIQKEVEEIANAMENTDPASHVIPQEPEKEAAVIPMFTTEFEPSSEEAVPASAAALSDPDWFVNSPLSKLKASEKKSKKNVHVKVKVVPVRKSGRKI